MRGFLLLRIQIPLGVHPAPPGAKVRSQARPWWGVGTVLPLDTRCGQFVVCWKEYGDGTRLLSIGQAEALQIVLVPPEPKDS